VGTFGVFWMEAREGLEVEAGALRCWRGVRGRSGERKDMDLCGLVQGQNVGAGRGGAEIARVRWCGLDCGVSSPGGALCATNRDLTVYFVLGEVEGWGHYLR
jgi:hypothetical protein